MTEALEPRLTKLDERVLAVLSHGRAMRLLEVYRATRPHLSPEDVRLILRGFEHLGRVECRGGWWRRIA